MYYHESMPIKYKIHYAHFHKKYDKQTTETRSLQLMEQLKGRS